MEYVENGPFPYNNFIYKVALSSPLTAVSFSAVQACTVLPSDGISNIIVRLSNPLAMGMNNANRVENEVAAMELARRAVRKRGYADIVPCVYAWKSAQLDRGEEGFGWVVMEYKEGEMLDRVFKTMDVTEREKIVEDVAGLFAALQRVELPRGVSMHGGLTIKDGEIVSGEATLVEGGPWMYVDAWKGRIESVLREADESEVIAGWEGSLRARIERFKNDVLEGVIRDAGVDMALLGLVHNDFCKFSLSLERRYANDVAMNNINYDTGTKRITALLDFDWASVTHPAHEFFMSFHDLHGGMGEDSEKLQVAILTGDFTSGPCKEDDKEAWEIAKLWDEAVKKHGGKRPSDFKGIQTLYMLKTFADKICPFMLGKDVLVKGWKTAEENEGIRKKAEVELEGMLDVWGV